MPILLSSPLPGPVISPNYNASVQQGSQVYLTVSVPGKGNIPVGYVQQLSQSDTYGSEGFYGLGHIDPFEIQPLQFVGQLTLSGGKLYWAGWMGQLFGGAAEILTSGALNVVLFNRVLNAPEVVYVGFVVQSYNVTYSMNAYVIQSMTGLYRTLQVANDQYATQAG